MNEGGTEDTHENTEGRGRGKHVTGQGDNEATCK